MSEFFEVDAHWHLCLSFSAYLGRFIIFTMYVLYNGGNAQQPECSLKFFMITFELVDEALE